MTIKLYPAGARFLLLFAIANLTTNQILHAASFGDDLVFLQQHTDVVVLHDPSYTAQVAVAAAWQGRVLTSTAGGAGGTSFGWINRELIASGKLQQHINVYGGEDRFWMGPEGGQFSIFFAPGAKFELSDWFTPAPFDTLPYRLTKLLPELADFAAVFSLTNYSGTRFEVQVNREVRLLSVANAWQKLGVNPAPGVNLVAYETDNRITNIGKEPWRKETGLLSIWILGQFNPSVATTIVVPINSGPESDLGAKVTSDYFGAVPPGRLLVREDAIFFSGDGQFRSKIGVNPRRSKGVLGSYDAANRVLTIVQFTQPQDVTDYVNSQWKLQDHPFAGDVANSYNDGPPKPGAKPLGPFYETESSSPAAALAPGESLTHIHRTIHLSGAERDLDAVARAALGVSLMDIQNALKR
jgi:hypothetical protein